MVVIYPYQLNGKGRWQEKPIADNVTEEPEGQNQQLTL
jgi:hypothetical protein